ncbi:EpsG family protein [Caballeronia sp. Lep1P3]|uniref:EpsG family protein n=1 Tax=Caballeronia sp. Lep1P3 TaxID=2878150 RepID=UPI001FD5B077|nr:EpsG family protein [Caballeronia sp. Lep1P3]
MRKSAGLLDVNQVRRDDRSYFATPAGWAFLLLSFYIIWFLTTSERSIYTVADQDAYLLYFKYTDWAWLKAYFQHTGTGLGLIPHIITDEIGWRLWIIFVNSFGFTPESAIRLTVALSNILVFCALARLRRPLLGLLVWTVVPAALFTIGLFQLRQGFGFGVAMLFAIGLRRPVLGMWIASTIHTTFVIPALLITVARQSGSDNRIAIPVVVVAGTVLAASAQTLFDTFGGRRLDDYANYAAEFSVNLLVLLLSYGLASVLVIASLPYMRAVRLRAPLRDLALMHLGLLAYLVCAFVFFPLGKDRVFYYISLLLPFLMQEIRVKDGVTLWMTTVLFCMMAADVYLASQKGVYWYFLR